MALIYVHKGSQVARGTGALEDQADSDRRQRGEEILSEDQLAGIKRLQDDCCEGI